MSVRGARTGPFVRCPSCDRARTVSWSSPHTLRCRCGATWHAHDEIPNWPKVSAREQVSCLAYLLATTVVRAW